MKNAAISGILFAALVVSIAMSVAGAAQQDAVNAYDDAIARWTVGSFIGTADLTVQIDDNDPAVYTIKMWSHGSDTGISVITASDVDFLLGLAMLQQERQVTAWWPTLETFKTFASSQTEQEIGLGGGWLEQVAQHPDDYTATFVDEDANEWRLELRPAGDGGLFARAIVHVTKPDRTISAAEFYDDADAQVESDQVSDYTEEQEADGSTILFPLQTVVVDLTADKTTTIVYTDLSFPEHIDDAMFTLDSLKQIAAQALAGEL